MDHQSATQQAAGTFAMELRQGKDPPLAEDAVRKDSRIRSHPRHSRYLVRSQVLAVPASVAFAAVGVAHAAAREGVCIHLRAVVRAVACVHYCCPYP